MSLQIEERTMSVTFLLTNLSLIVLRFIDNLVQLLLMQLLQCTELLSDIDIDCAYKQHADYSCCPINALTNLLC